MLVGHLPSESATMTALRNAAPDVTGDAAEQANPAERPWSQDQMLLAAIVDTLRDILWMYSTVQSGGKSQTPRPEPVVRPGVAWKPKKLMTVATYRMLTGEEPPAHLIRGEVEAG